MEGTLDQLTLRLQVLTGMELDENRVLRVLNATQWQERRQRLDKAKAGRTGS